MHSTTHITSNNNITAGSFGRGMSNNVGGGGKAPHLNKINQSNQPNQSLQKPNMGRPANAPPPVPSRQQISSPAVPKIPFPVTSKPINQQQPAAALQNHTPAPHQRPNQPIPANVPIATIQDQRSRSMMPPPQPQPQPQQPQQQRPQPSGIVGAPAPLVDVVDDFSESQLRALERMEEEHLRKSAQTHSTAGANPSVQSTNHQNLIQQATAAVAGAKSLPQAPNPGVGNISPPRPQMAPQQKPVHVTSPQSGQVGDQHRLADPEKPKMLEEITNLRKMLDAARKDRANAENMLQNQLEAEKKKAQLLEQEKQRLQSELAFAKNDGEQQAANTTAPSKSAIKSQNGVVTVGGVDMVLRKNTQHQQGNSPASRHRPAASASKEALSRPQLLIVQTPANQLAAQPPVPSIPADPDTSPDHSGRKSASKKRKRTTEVIDQNNQVDVSFDEADWDSQTVDDLMQVDAESDGSLNGATGKNKRQLRQFRSAFHLLQRLFVPSCGAAAPSVEPLDETAIVSKVRDVVLKNVLEVLDEKLSTMGDYIVESLSKRRKLAEPGEESGTPSSQNTAKLQSLQKHLQDTIFQRDSAVKKLEQAEMEVARMRTDLERSADRIRLLQEEHSAAIVRYDKKFSEIDAAFQQRLNEMDVRYREAVAISASKDERIEELQSLVAQLVVVVQGHQEDAHKGQADVAPPTPAIAPQDEMELDEIVENNQGITPGGALTAGNVHKEACQVENVAAGAPSTSGGIEIEIGTSE